MKIYRDDGIQYIIYNMLFSLIRFNVHFLFFIPTNNEVKKFIYLIEITQKTINILLLQD